MANRLKKLKRIKKLYKFRFCKHKSANKGSTSKVGGHRHSHQRTSSSLHDTAMNNEVDTMAAAQKPDNNQDLENDSMDDDESTISVMDNDENGDNQDDSASVMADAIEGTNQTTSSGNSQQTVFTKSSSSVVNKPVPSPRKPGASSQASSTLSLQNPPAYTSQSSKDDVSEYMESFLQLVRNGNYEQINELIQLSNSTAEDGSPTGKTSSPKPSKKLDLNYRGKTKRFYGWTSLHISCYFNHFNIVKLLLQVCQSVYYPP